MKVKNLHLYRFRGFEDLKVSFPKDAPLIVFIGENGSGKSSLLEAMSMILRDAFYKYHSYDKVDWNNPKNVQIPHLYGKIAIELQSPKRNYEFSQSISIQRIRFISEDRLALELHRDLTEEERMEHYKAQAEMAFNAELYDKAVEYYLILVGIQEKLLDSYNINLANSYHNIAFSYSELENHSETIIFYEKELAIQQIQSTNDEIVLAKIYYAIGLSYSYLNNYEKALEFYEKVLQIAFNDDTFLAKIYYSIGLCYSHFKNYDKSLEYNHKALIIREQKLASDDINLANTYNNIGVNYHNLNKHSKAVEYFQKALEIKEKKEVIDDNSLRLSYTNLGIGHSRLGNAKKATYYQDKAKGLDKNEKEIKPFIPKLYLENDAKDLEHFNEYVETLQPLILHYTTQQSNIENFKSALPIAFNIPMTTDFDMISDWFIEHENDENRKRLRADDTYRSPELQAIRQVVEKGLTLLNGEKEHHFSELQTEIDENVKDGQVSSWLSIRKNGTRLNVHQLSDGEKRVIVLLIDITRRLITLGKQNKSSAYFEGTGIVLIDEIEEHLHPKWQRSFLPTLCKIFPNLQFVATTHSPQVLSYVPNGCAFALENGKAYPQNTYGRNNEWILEAIMDDVSRPVEVQAKLDAYFDLIREEKWDLAATLRTELEEMIGADEPELLKADILIRRKQKSMAKNEAN